MRIRTFNWSLLGYLATFALMTLTLSGCMDFEDGAIQIAIVTEVNLDGVTGVTLANKQGERDGFRNKHTR